jgi:hypothetical protein
VSGTLDETRAFLARALLRQNARNAVALVQPQLDFAARAMPARLNYFFSLHARARAETKTRPLRITREPSGVNEPQLKPATAAQ